jgi:S1-C subfamily serine protease
MVPMEIIDRVFRIAYDGGEGTGFALDVDGRQYLVTARHVIDADRPVSIAILQDNIWKSVLATPLGPGATDVAVFSLPVLIAHPEMVLDVSPGGFYMAQDVFFAGFPLGIETAGVQSSFPTPLIKKAIISGKAPGGVVAPFYLDGHVNPGFSGGPVFLKLPGAERYTVAMVVSSFEGTVEPVFDGDSEHDQLTVIANAGIIRALSISNAIDLIRSNPIGCSITRSAGRQS